MPPYDCSPRRRSSAALCRAQLAWIEQRCACVDDHVCYEHDDRHDKSRTEQDGIVAIDDADKNKRANARKSEDVFNDDDPAEKETELNGADGQIGNQSIAQGMARQDDPFRRHPWRAPCAHSPNSAPPSSSFA